MSQSEKASSQLTEAAESLENELRRFERLTAALNEAPLDSEKSLERAAKTLQDLGDSDQLLAQKVQALVAAINGVRERQQVQARAVEARAHELQQRTEVFQGLLQRYAALGKAASDLNGLMQQLASLKRDEASQEQRVELITGLTTLQARVGDVAGEAGSLADASRDSGFADLSRQADSLRQQLLAARNKMGLLQKGLGQV